MATFQSYSERMLYFQSVNQKRPLLPSPIRNVPWYLKPSSYSTFISGYQHNLVVIVQSFKQAFKICFSGGAVQHG